MSEQEELRALALLRSQKPQGALRSIYSLVEPQSFVELEAYCGADASGEGLCAGYAVIEGRSVFIYAHEHDVLKGALGINQARKLERLIEKAVSTGTPVIGVINSNGALLNEGLCAAEGYGLIIKSAAKASGRIPHIVIIDGPAAGTGALYAQCADFVIIKKCSRIKLPFLFIRFLKGRLLELKNVELHRCKKIQLNVEPALPVNVDGELLDALPLEAQIIPQAITIFTP